MLWLDDEGLRAFYHSKYKHYRNSHSVSHKQNRRNADTLVIERYGEYWVCSVGSSRDSSKDIAFNVRHVIYYLTIYDLLFIYYLFAIYYLFCIVIARKDTNNIRKNQKMKNIFYFFSIEIL